MHRFKITIIQIEIVIKEHVGFGYFTEYLQTNYEIIKLYKKLKT